MSRKERMDKSLRVASIIKKSLLEIIQFKVDNPNIGFISIPEVKVNSDYSLATVYISCLDEKEEKSTIAALNHSKGYIRSELAKRLDTRRCPDLKFQIYKGFKNQEKIEEILSSD